MTSVTDTTKTLTEMILDEGAVGLSELARLVGRFRGGRQTSPSTLTRWILEGVRLPDGKVLKLEAVRIHSRWMSSRPRLIEFIERQQPTPAPVAPPRSPAARRKAAEAAAKLLEAAGA